MHGTATRIALESVGNIPNEMKTRPQWVVWRYVEKANGKLDKTPFQPNHTARMARTNDPSGWSTFDKALGVYEANPLLDGVGYVFDEEDPYTGFDFDSCLDPDTGVLHKSAAELVEDLGGYAEVSPSGTGVKVIVKAHKPGTRYSTKKTPWGDEFALYEKGRFFALTGRVFGEHREIREAQGAVDRAYLAILGEGEKTPETAPQTTPRGGSGGRGAPLKDDELIEKALGSKTGERFRRHYVEGDASGWPSRSEADASLLADLCFWTNADEEQMVRIFTGSALYVLGKGQGYVRRSARKAIRTHQGGFYRTTQQRPTEILELVEALEQRWWNERFPGTGGKTLASMMRALIREGERNGTVVEGEGLRVSFSVRQLAEIAGCHYNTVLNATRRAVVAGMLRKEPPRKEGLSATFVLLDPRPPRQTCDTPEDTSPPRVLEGVTTSSRLSLSRLSTAHFRGRGNVGKGAERLLVALEAHGPISAGELAETFGWSRPRDLKRRYLEPLVALGLVEALGDGVYALVGDFREAQDRARRVQYSTIQLRLSRRYVFEAGRRLLLTEVAETGSIASEEERALKDKADHACQQAAHRCYLEERRKAKEREPEDEREVIEFLNAWDEERGTESFQTAPLEREMRRSGSALVEFSGAEVEDLERFDVPDDEEASTTIGADEVFALALEMFAC